MDAALDIKRFDIALALTDGAAEIMQEMMFDYRTTDPNDVAKIAIAMLAKMRTHGKWIIPDEFDEWGNNMTYVYGTGHVS